MKYLSVCSGIEAATVAWHPLGWQPSAFSEIEAFPSAVLAHHYPNVPNLGDMTKFQEWPNEPIDLLVGGTPCQSFSVAGLRKGLADPRGNLALTYLAIVAQYRPRWLVWENVPGALSSLSHDAPDTSPPDYDMDMGRGGKEVEITDIYNAEELHAFNSFLAGLSELGYGFCWRILDAQYLGLAQRRKRVFVVGYLGDWRPPAAVLIERESLQGHPAPRRETGEGAAGGAESGAGDGRWPADVASTLNSHFGDKMGLEDQHALNGASLFVPATAHALRGEGHDASEDGTGRGTPLVPVAHTIEDSDNETMDVGETRTLPLGHVLGSCFHMDSEVGRRAMVPVAHTDLMPTMQNGADTEAGHNARSGHTKDSYIVPVAFDMRGRDGGAMLEGPHDTANMRAASGGSSRSYVAFDTTQITSAENGSNPKPGDPCHPLAAGAHAPSIASPTCVRRLTPRECERLQGFPDDYTLIPYRNGTAKDGPRYKALGNSMAVPVMRWIGERIEMVEDLMAETTPVPAGR